VALYVSKSLALGAIRFSVEPTIGEPPPDGGRIFNTDAAGHFIRTRSAGHFYQDTTTAGTARGRRPTFRTTGRARKPLSWYLPIISTVFGLLLIFLGIAVFVVAPNPSGYIYIALGIVFAGGPWYVTARKRRELKERLERERLEQEEAERQRRELIGEYLDRVDALPQQHDRESIEALRQLRMTREIPFEEVTPRIQQAIIRLAFIELDRVDQVGVPAVATTIDDASEAAGLADEKRHEVKYAVFESVAWHLIADGRVGEHRQRALDQLRQEFGLSAEEVRREMAAMEEYRRVREIRVETLPRVPAPGAPLKFGEICHLMAKAREMKLPSRSMFRRQPAGADDSIWRESGDRDVVVSSRRVLLLPGRKREIPYERIDQLELDADHGVLTVAADDSSKSVHLQMEEPLVAGVLIDLAVASGGAAERQPEHRVRTAARELGQNA
jgi:hypothetical protein